MCAGLATGRRLNACACPSAHACRESATSLYGQLQQAHVQLQTLRELSLPAVLSALSTLAGAPLEGRPAAGALVQGLAELVRELQEGGGQEEGEQQQQRVADRVAALQVLEERCRQEQPGSPAAVEPPAAGARCAPSRCVTKRGHSSRAANVPRPCVSSCAQRTTPATQASCARPRPSWRRACRCVWGMLLGVGLQGVGAPLARRWLCVAPHRLLAPQELEQDRDRLHEMHDQISQELAARMQQLADRERQITAIHNAAQVRLTRRGPIGVTRTCLVLPRGHADVCHAPRLCFVCRPPRLSWRRRRSAPRPISSSWTSCPRCCRDTPRGWRPCAPRQSRQMTCSRG